MRLPRALTGAMRTRRTSRISLDQADRLVAGDQPGSQHRGLSDLLDAAKAPATAEELAGEQAAVAAFAAARERAAPPKGTDRVRVSRSARVAVVNAAAGLALLAIGGTAVAARTGNLPDGAQQHAHRLFSALGVPAPRTGPTITTAPSPTPGRTAHPTSSPAPTPAPTTGAPSRAATATDTVPLGWCRAWQARPGGKALKGESRRRLIAAAGGEKNVDQYCASLTAAATASPSASASASPAPGTTTTKPHGKPSTHPTPHATTPSHPGKNTPSHPGKKK
jgi:hypothetical protein